MLRAVAGVRQANRPLRLVDFNSMFSFSGGGIRTYHEHKLDYFAERDDVEYALLVPSDRDAVEERGRAKMYHLEAFPIPGVSHYYLFSNVSKLRRLLTQLEPDLVEAGGAYVDPVMCRYVARRLDTVFVGFWHTQYPTAYFETIGRKLSARTGSVLRELGWRYARSTYGFFDAVFVAADSIIEELKKQGIERIIQCPLGTDAEVFHPDHADSQLRAQVNAQGRKLVLFPHRFSDEKGISQVVEAVPAIAAETEAVFVFAGKGPKLSLVEALCEDREDCHFLGFIDSAETLARWYATADLAFGLSAWETFGLSVVESMASGTPLVAANQGAANDWVTRARCGRTVPHGDTEALELASVELLLRPDLAEIGSRGRRFVEQNFSWEKTFERMLSHYERLVAAHRSGVPMDDFPYLWETGA